MQDHIVAEVDDIPEGERIIVQVKGRDIGIFNLNGEFYAYTNWCPHKGGPICQGKLSGTTDGEFDRATLTTQVTWMKDGEIILCPWHGWEFDLKSGQGVHDQNVQLPSYPIRVENGKIILSI